MTADRVIEPDDPGWWPCQSKGHFWSGLIFRAPDGMESERCIRCSAQRIVKEAPRDPE